MIRLPQDSTEVLATNFWFGSPLCDTFSAGTAALERLFSEAFPVTRMQVNCRGLSATEHNISHFADYLAAFHRLRDHLRLRGPRHVVNIGGGCAAAIAIVPYLQSVHADLRVVWIDAHYDLHLPSTSQSHYVHGMTVGILTDPQAYASFFEDSWCLDPSRLLFCGQKTADPYERRFIDQHALASIPGDFGMKRQPTGVLAEVNDHPVYIHLDLDAMRPGVFPNPKCGIPTGLGFDDLSALVSAIGRASQVVGYSIAESPASDDAAVRQVGKIFLEPPTRGERVFDRDDGAPSRTVPPRGRHRDIAVDGRGGER